MIKPPDWSIDRLRSMELPQLRQLLKNAEARGVEDLVAKCQEVLAERAPAKSSAARPQSDRPAATRRSARDVVSEFHFVCENDRGVRGDGEGFFWTGFWTVPEADVIKSIEAGGKLALHASTSEPSYRQGRILDYRTSTDDTAKKRTVSIEFLVAADDTPLAWVGTGSGETGYKWASDAPARHHEQR